jgi:hypothetical protein
VQFWLTVPEVPVRVKTQQTPNLKKQKYFRFFVDVAVSNMKN